MKQMQKTDPVLLEILLQRFQSIPEEMAYALQRTGYTVFVNETADLGVALVSPKGEIFGYPNSIGITMFANLDFSDIISAFDKWEPGDIAIWNDPYTSGGVASHLTDVHVIKPLFFGNDLICFVFAYVHSTDVGGKVPGSLSPTSHEIFQEGIRIPPTKVYKRDVLNEEFLNYYLNNCRAPKDNRGDMRAMVTALKVGEERVLEIINRYGVNVFNAAIEDVLDYSARRASRAIESIPDGEYSFSDFLDDDVVTSIPVKLCVKIIVDGSRLHLDFTGSDIQVRSAFNLYSQGKPHPWVVYKILFLLKTIDALIPVNAGILKAVTVTIPKGSILNCEFPAAVGLRTTTGVRVQDAICGAFAQALPEVIPAAGAGYVAPIVFAQPGVQGEVKVTVLEPMVGGTGASAKGDGLNARDVVDIANLRNNPVEVVESSASVCIHKYGLRPDSGGAGLFRGGCGQEIEFEALSPDCVVTVRGHERHKFAPWGLNGGQCGAKAEFSLKRIGSDIYEHIERGDSLELSVGDKIRIRTPGGGGFGDPLERSPNKVLQDVRAGIVSVGQAESFWGVIIRDGVVDNIETSKLREQMKSTELADQGQYTLGPDREAYDRIWTPQLWKAFIEIIYSLPTPFRSEARKLLWESVMASVAQDRTPTPDTLEQMWSGIAQKFGDLEGAVA